MSKDKLTLIRVKREICCNLHDFSKEKNIAISLKNGKRIKINIFFLQGLWSFSLGTGFQTSFMCM